MTIVLTNLLNTNSVAKITQNLRLRSDISRIAAGLEDPENYLTGYSPKNEIDPPFGILCFTRRNAPQLLRSSGQFHRDHHHRHVLVCALRGSGEICVDDRMECLEPGSAVFLSPYQFHHYRSFSARQITWLFVTFELRTDFLVRGLKGRGALPLDSNDLSLLKQLLRAWEGDREDPQLSLLLGAFLRGLRLKAHRPPDEAISPAANSDLLQQINTLVLQKDCFPLKELAAALGISQSGLRARFRTATGLSLGQHIRSLRLQKACSLLASSSLRVHQVAEACRFNSVYAFSRSFRVGVGVSPARYRRRQQKYNQRYIEADSARPAKS